MIQDILNAHSPRDFFGENEKRAGITYRRYARALHPDINHNPKATEAFQKLNNYWEEYSNLKKYATPSKGKSSNKNTIRVNNTEYDLMLDIQTDRFYTRYKTQDGKQVLITSTKEDNDLAQNHVDRLKEIRDQTPDELLGFFPRVVDTFTTTHGCLGILQEIPEGFVPFTEIPKSHPNGIGGRDLGWIFKRVFLVTELIHKAGLAHGGISLDSLYIHPELHGIILNDWQYAVRLGNSLQAVPFTNGYPSHFLNKEPVTKDLDIILAAAVGLKLSNGEEPQLDRFMRHASKSQNKTGDFWYNELDWLLRKIYGKPKFNKFTLSS